MSIMTKGFHSKVNPSLSKEELIELLINSVMIPPPVRKYYSLPKILTYFFSGFCDCHEKKKKIHLGKICSRCSSGNYK